MANEFFNWKSLFINDDSSAPKDAAAPVKQAPPAPTFQNKFPDQAMPPPIPQGSYSSSVNAGTGSTINNPFLADVLSVYEKGFESLNMSGFDFFEMYKSVMAVGASNPQAYQMAFTMGKTINPVLTKEFLLEKAKFYTAEIEKVYTKYDTDGNAKKMGLDNTLTAEKFNLTKTIEELEAKIVQLQSELQIKKEELIKIDSGSREKYSEIQLKIEANNLAKSRILESINTVVTGINQYL
jgi:hypothetical protein